jgi:hypothetical protein
MLACKGSAAWPGRASASAGRERPGLDLPRAASRGRSFWVYYVEKLRGRIFLESSKPFESPPGLEAADFFEEIDNEWFLAFGDPQIPIPRLSHSHYNFAICCFPLLVRQPPRIERIIPEVHIYC